LYLNSEIIDKALGKKKEQGQGNNSKRQKLNQTQRQGLHLLLVNAFSVAEQIRSMPTESSELDDFWSLHPSTMATISSSNDTNDTEEDGIDTLLGGSLSDVEDDENDAKKPATKERQQQPPLLQLRVHKQTFSKGWLAILRLPMTEEYYRRTLLIMHKRILPHLAEPRLLMDFLTDSYNVGGAISLLALNGIFTLITEHNL
jgi:U3 small nucleolar RNA-associated protein 19